MTWKSFLDALTTVATSPYAFVAYVCLLAGFVYWLVSQMRLNAIAKLPAGEQAAVLKEEYKVFPRSGLTGDEWIRSRRQTLSFWAFVVLVVAVVLLGTVSLLRVKNEPAIKTAESKPAEVTPVETKPAETTSTGAKSAKTVPASTNEASGTTKPISDTTSQGRKPEGRPRVALPTLGIPPPITGVGAPIGITLQNRYIKNNVECIQEAVKVSPTEWQERNASESPESCNTDAVIFRYTERESDDPGYFLIYEEGRNVLARMPNIAVGKTGASAWRQPPSKEWNSGRAVTRVE